MDTSGYREANGFDQWCHAAPLVRALVEAQSATGVAIPILSRVGAEAKGVENQVNTEGRGK